MTTSLIFVRISNQHGAISFQLHHSAVLKKSFRLPSSPFLFQKKKMMMMNGCCTAAFMMLMVVWSVEAFLLGVFRDSTARHFSSLAIIRARKVSTRETESTDALIFYLCVSPMNMCVIIYEACPPTAVLFVWYSSLTIHLL